MESKYCNDSEYIFLISYNIIIIIKKKIPIQIKTSLTGPIIKEILEGMKCFYVKNYNETSE